jgi:HK97 family phage major capsid protein
MTGNHNTLDGLDARHDALVAEARALLNTAGDTDLEGDELARYEQITAELDRLAERRGRLERLARHTATGSTESGDGATGGAQLMRRHDPYDMADRRLVGSEVKARALSALEQTVHLDDAYKARATELVERADLIDGRLARHIVVTGRTEYRRGWQKLVSGNSWAITADEQAAIAEARAASLSGSAGGYAVPFTLDPTLILTNTGSSNPWRRISRQVSIVTDDWNGVSTAGITAAWAAEGAEAGDNAPTLAQPSITVKKAHAFVPFSIEVGMDWAGMEADIRDAFADAKDRLEGTAFATGNGTSAPKGIITALVAASTPIQASATTDTFAVADVYATLEKCPPRHRSNGTWVANLSIINKIRQFGTSNNYSGFTVDLTAAGIPQLLGRPLYESSDMDGSITGSADNYVLVFGNFDRFQIVDRVGMSVELVPHLFHVDNNRPSGSRGLYAYWRVGADCTDTSAFGLLNVT